MATRGALSLGCLRGPCSRLRFRAPVPFRERGPSFPCFASSPHTNAREEKRRDREMKAVMVPEEAKGPMAPALGKKNRIQVSTNKKPLYFYVNLAKRYMQQYNEIELSALGMAIGTVVKVAEILKNNGLATEKKILTSTVDSKDETKGRLIRKAKIEILLGKTDNSNGSPTTEKANHSKAANENTKEESKEETNEEV